MEETRDPYVKWRNQTQKDEYCMLFHKCGANLNLHIYVYMGMYTYMYVCIIYIHPYTYVRVCFCVYNIKVERGF